MGLLSKASNAEISGHAPLKIDVPEEGAEFFLDEMGAALKERISRLPDEPDTPYTVLSLLKAYGNFQTAVILALKDGKYSGISSLGMGLDNASIPLENIWSSENARHNFFMLDSKMKQGSSFIQAETEYWAIPLPAPNAPSMQPWEGLMILGVTANGNMHSIFDVESIAAIISGNTGKILLSLDIGQNPNDAETVSGENEAETAVPGIGSMDNFSIGPNSTVYDSIQGKLTQYQKSHNEFNCIILEIPVSAGGDEKVHFCENVVNMVGMAGSVIPLSSGCPLILLPREADRELIAHRLSGSLDTKPVMSFRSNSPKDACDTIHSLL